MIQTTRSRPWLLSRSWPALALAALTFLVAAPEAQAQKASRDVTTCPQHGFQMNAIDGFDAVPVDVRNNPTLALKFGTGESGLNVYAFEDPKAKGPKGRTVAAKRRTDIIDYLKGPARLRLPGFEEAADAPGVDEEVEIDGTDARHRRYSLTSGKETMTLDLWSFQLPHADVHLVYLLNDDFSRRWEKALTDSAESFERIERTKDEVGTGERTYEDQLKWAENEADKTPGWYAIGTPSKRFVILTNAEKKAFVKEVIKRLEIARDVYEKDFPPPANFEAVSVVRICKDRQEFMRFGDVGPQVGGYFNPRTVELVLYDNVEEDRNATYAVVVHEAFHQYCHFLFNESEAHRWFDEGHGDYYGGMKVSGSRGKITPKMPAGYDRLGPIRNIVRQNAHTPLDEHLNFTHSQWQALGIASYAQSWSIVYMLRQGANGKLRGKFWKDEYKDIIPTYVKTLNDGFADAYKTILDERRAEAKKDGVELAGDDLLVNRFNVDPRRMAKMKKKIWSDAMAASWGKVDLKQFEEDWKYFVLNRVK